MKNISLPHFNLLLNLMNSEGFYLLEYSAVYFVESQPTFRMNTSPPSSGSKSKPSKEVSVRTNEKQNSAIYPIFEDPLTNCMEGIFLDKLITA
jgi:hypothetical protein